MRRSLAIISFTALIAAACGEPAQYYGGKKDGGKADGSAGGDGGGTTDGGATDGGTADGGNHPDGGTTPDAGQADSGGLPDAGGGDAGGLPDSGAPDAAGGPDAGGPDASFPDAGPTGWDGGVMALQPFMLNWQLGQPISIYGVVVTASNHGSGSTNGFFHVQDPGGGPNTGVLVFRSKGTSALVLPNRGDVVAVTGTMDDFQGQREVSGTVTPLSWTVLQTNPSAPGPGSPFPAAAVHQIADMDKDPSATGAENDLGGRVVLANPMTVVNLSPPELFVPTADGGFYTGFEVAESGTTTPSVLVGTRFKGDLLSCWPSPPSAFSTLGGVFMAMPRGDGGTAHGPHILYPAGCDEFAP